MRKLKTIAISMLLAFFIIGNVAIASNGVKKIDVLFNTINLEVNGDRVGIDNILYNGTTYAPVRAIAEMLGKEVGWDSKTNTASINDTQNITLDEDFIIHGFYALESYNQFNDFYRSRTLNNFNSISYGWSKIDIKDNEIKLLLSGEDSKDFYVPSGYNQTLNTAETNEISNQLMVYADNNFTEIFENKEVIIDNILEVVNGENMSYGMLSFDGVTIDFEFVNEANQEDFVEFLKTLKDKLDEKQLYVAVPPVNTFSHYLFEDIMNTVDYMIIMEHDYDDKQLQSGYVGNSVVKTPLSPIDKIESDIKSLISIVGEDNENKILLQISFGTTQWGVKNGSLYPTNGNSEYIKPNNPTYTQVYDRINKEINEKNLTLNDLIHFDEESQNPYLEYFNDDIGVQYYIWYENSRSVLEKIELTQKYDLAGISLWRIGSIPNYYGENGEEIGFDIWNKINELKN